MNDSYSQWLARRREESKLAYAALMKFYPLTLDDLPDEIWLPVPDYEGYHVSNFGRVKSFKYKTPRIIKPALRKLGYLRVVLSKGDKIKDFSVHRLVALAFIPNPDNKREINHIDGNRFNNHVSNLEWCTSSENRQHAVATGLRKSGEEHHEAKLTNKQVVYIRENPDGLNTYEFAKIFGVTPRTIGLVQRGMSYKNVGGTIRQSKPHPPNVPVEVREAIHTEYKAGIRGFGCASLAKKYGISKTTVHRIVSRS